MNTMPTGIFPAVADIPVNPKVLRWARAERSLSLHDAADRLNLTEQQLADVENGSSPVSLGLLRQMEARYRIPLAALCMPEPPPGERPQEDLVDHRSPATKRDYGIGIDTAVAIQEVREALEAFAELRAFDEALVPAPRLDKTLAKETPEALAARQRRKLGVSILEQLKVWNSTAQARDHWRLAIEAQGVFVYLLPMDVNECRGFSMLHEGLAAICVNDNEENAGAESFTMLHEYCHLLRRQTGISDENRTNSVERYCNKFAGAVLIPAGELRSQLNSPTQPYEFSTDVVARLARKFKVSQRAMAMRLEETGLAPSGFYARHTAAWDVPKPKPPQLNFGGPSVAERAARSFGRRHSSTVLTAFRKGALNAVEAYGLLSGVPVTQFGALTARIE